jgi:putative acetyltransferase
MIIREADDSDLKDVLYVETAAFGHDIEAELVRELLDDPTAKPLLSLVAYENDKAVGHVLFTKASLLPEKDDVSIMIMAPLAVIPQAQRKGVGTALVKRGIEILKTWGIDLIFVVGDWNYYPRHGFLPAIIRGFDPPYPLPKEHEEAWMVQSLKEEVIGSVSGKIRPADALDKPEHWRDD